MASHDLLIVPWEDAAGLRLGRAARHNAPAPRTSASPSDPREAFPKKRLPHCAAPARGVVTLGPRILRAETAAVAAAAVVMALWGDL